MKFCVRRKDIAGETLEFERSAWTGHVKVRMDGKELQRLNEKNRPFDLPMKDKSRKKIFIRARWLDPVPVVLIDKEEVLLAERLRPIDYIFGCFPISMFLVYGSFSTLIGFFLLLGNFRILRTKMSPTIKWAAIYAGNLAAFWAVTAVINMILPPEN